MCCVDFLWSPILPSSCSQMKAKTTVCKAEDTAESTSGDAPCLSSLHPSRPYVPTSPHDAASGTVPKKRPMPNQSHPLAKRLCTAMATLPSKGAPESESGGGASAALALQPAAKQVSQAEPTALEHSHTEGRPDGPPPPRSVPSSKPSPGETVTATPSGGVLEDAGDAAKGKRLDPICHSSGPPVGGVATSPTSADGADKCNGITAAPMDHHTRRKRLPTAARAPPPKQKRGCKQPRPVVTGGRKAVGLTVCPYLSLLCL